MGNKSSIPEGSLKNLKCYNCKEILSCPPIYLTTGQKNICGRCQSPEASIRNVLYEEIVTNYTFPCINEGCKDELLLASVESHEKQCPHKSIRCPFTLCEEKLKLNVIEKHFNQHHTDNIIKCLNHMAIFKSVPMNELTNNIFLISYDKLKMLLFVKNNDDKKFYTCNFSFALFSIQTDIKLNYKLQLDIDYEYHHRNFCKTEQQIPQYDEEKHCFKCFSNLCSVHTTATSNICSLDFTNIRRGTETTKVSYIIYMEYIEKCDKDLTDQHSGQKKLKVECPLCNGVMRAPMFLCTTGHTFCHKCTVKLEKCPLCRNVMTKTRNYMLEDLADVQ